MASKIYTLICHSKSQIYLSVDCGGPDEEILYGPCNITTGTRNETTKTRSYYSDCECELETTFKDSKCKNFYYTNWEN